MINLRKVKKYCKDYTRIENYEEAVNDNTQTWHCHHILGEILSREQLKDHDFYYDVPPCMLKFVTETEHKSLHNKGKCPTEEHRRKISEANKGRSLNEEWRKKLGESHKGKHHSDDTRRKISDAKKGKPSNRKGVTLSEETRRKLSEAAKRRCARKRESISHHELA